MYYLRTKAATQAIQFTVDKSSGLGPGHGQGQGGGANRSGMNRKSGSTKKGDNNNDDPPTMPPGSSNNLPQIFGESCTSCSGWYLRITVANVWCDACDLCVFVVVRNYNYFLLEVSIKSIFRALTSSLFCLTRKAINRQSLTCRNKIKTFIYSRTNGELLQQWNNESHVDLSQQWNKQSISDANNITFMLKRTTQYQSHKTFMLKQP